MENQFELLREQYELLENKYAEKSFKFLTIHQITKSIAKEKNINNLKKLILDMLFEVSLVKRGLCFEIKNQKLMFLDSKNFYDFLSGDELNLENRKNEIEFLEKVSIIEIGKLNERKILPEIFGKFEEGYCLTFLGNNESFETMLIVLGEKSYGTYSEVDDEFLVTIRGQVDIILENAIKTHMIEKKNKELIEKNFNLSLINEFAVKLGSTLDMKELYSLTKKLINENFNSINVLAYSYDSDTYKLTIEKDIEEEDESDIISLLDYSDFEISQLTTGTIGINNEKQESFGICKKINEELNRRKGLGSDYIVPLTSNGNLLGIIGFRSEKNLDLDFLETLKQQISMYIQNGTLYTMAITDSMTKLYLQTYFKERIEGELKRYERLSQEFSLIILDIDHFKKFNDNYGHLVGDYVLKEVAKIIKVSVRKLDIVSRYGGEEFGVILLGATSETAVTVAERIRYNIENRIFSYMGQEMRVTISGGVAHVKDIDVYEHTEIIKVADKALYESKNNGRNKITLYKR